MSEYNINDPFWTWASADGSLHAHDTAPLTGMVNIRDAVTGGVRPSPDKRYDSPLLNERETTHGDWNKTAETAQRLKTVLADARRLPHAQQEALDMICTKLARIVCGNASEPDHWKDLAGYATLVVENLKP